MRLLQLTRISKSFGPVQALEDVDLEVAQGEVLGLNGGFVMGAVFGDAGAAVLLSLLAPGVAGVDSASEEEDG